MFFEQPMLAIDMGSSSIKVVEVVGGSKGGKKLRTMGLEMLPSGAIQAGVIHDLRAVETALKKLFRKLRLSTRGRRAVISLGGSSVIIKKARFPGGADAVELSETVYYEAEQHFQHDINDLYFDFYQLPNASNTTEIPVVLVGAKRDVVEAFMGVVKSHGLKIGVVDCDAFALSNMLEYNHGKVAGLSALIHVGASSTQVILLGHGEYLYTRDLGLGGSHYGKSMAAKLGMTEENADMLKISTSMGQSPAAPELQRVIAEINDHLVSEIQMTFDFFFKSGDSPPEFNAVQHAFLCGGGSKTIGLDAAIGAALRIPVHLINPFHRVEMPKAFSMEKIANQGHMYGVALGLALRDMKHGKEGQF